MCSRYTVGADPKTIAERFAVAAAPGARARFNLAPSQEAPVVLLAPERRMALLKWGLTPAWAKESPTAKPMINARAETAADKPFFRDAFRWRRALVPADGWYEWPKRGEKIPRWYSLRNGALFAFAGLWEPGTFAILTTEPNALAAQVHDRMPAILPRALEEEWLDPKTRPDRLKEMLVPYPAEELAVRVVSTKVGSSASDEPSLRDAAPQSQGELF